MNNNIVYLSNVLGNYKTILGDGKTDIVLDTLSKVYIKTGNNLKLINTLINNLDNFNNHKNESLKVIIVKSLDSLEYPGDGYLIFDLYHKALYISYDLRYILILDSININDSTIDFKQTEEKPKEEYVKKIGDLMTGLLQILTEGAPLIVASKELIRNLNTEYFNNLSSEEYAKINYDEYIYGLWTFDSKTIFNNRIVVNQNIGTSTFIPGYNGIGWQLDSATNTLTVDYLIIRKAMMVYELIINQISATNGSIWISDTEEIDKVEKVYFIDVENNNSSESISKNFWFIPYIKDVYNHNSLAITGEHLANSLGDFENASINFDNFGFIVKFNSKTPQIIDYNNLSLEYAEIAQLFKDSYVDENNCKTNAQYNINTTPFYFSTKNKKTFKNPNTDVQKIYSYYKYFGCSLSKLNLYVITIKDTSKYIHFKENDIIRCQKFTNGNIKYYDALVAAILNKNQILVIVTDSVFDKYTSIDKNKNISEHFNTYTYSQTNFNEDVENSTREENLDYLNIHPELLITLPEPKDVLVRIGNLKDINRLGSIYMTASEKDSPFITVLNDVDRPDYLVIYTKPKFKIFKKDSINYFCKKVDSKVNDECIEEKGIWYSLQLEPDIHCEIEKNDKDEYLGVLDLKVKTKFGNINNTYNDLFQNKQPHGYGLYGENVYLTGEFYLNNGKSIVEFTEESITIATENSNRIIQSIKIQQEELNKNMATKVDTELLKTAGCFIENDTISLFGDLVNVYTTKKDLEVGNMPTAMFTDGAINTNLIRTDKLEVNKLIGVIPHKNIIFSDPTNTNSIEYKYVLIGYFGYGNSYGGNMTKTDSLGNIIHLVCDVFLQDFTNKLFYSFYETQENDLIFTHWYQSDPTKEEYFVNLKDINPEFIELDISIAKYAHITKDVAREKTVTINELGFGENILYWPDESIMNCKVFNTKNNEITGCVEYFFNKGTVKIADIKQGSTHLDAIGYIKRIDYFAELSYIVQSHSFKYLNDNNLINWNNVLVPAQVMDLKSLVKKINQLYKDCDYKALSDIWFYIRKEVSYSPNGKLDVKYPYSNCYSVSTQGSDAFIYVDNTTPYQVNKYIYKEDPIGTFNQGRIGVNNQKPDNKQVFMDTVLDNSVEDRILITSITYTYGMVEWGESDYTRLGISGILIGDHSSFKDNFNFNLYRKGEGPWQEDAAFAHLTKIQYG